MNRPNLPVRPPLARETSVSIFSTGAQGAGVHRTDVVSVTGTCKPCMAAARDVYDDLHRTHVAEANAPARAPSPAPDAPKPKG